MQLCIVCIGILAVGLRINIYKVRRVCVRVRPLGRVCEGTVRLPLPEDKISGEFGTEVVGEEEELCESPQFRLFENKCLVSAFTPPDMPRRC
jgi:hypothetical protein